MKKGLGMCPFRGSVLNKGAQLVLDAGQRKPDSGRIKGDLDPRDLELILETNIKPKGNVSGQGLCGQARLGPKVPPPWGPPQ